MSIFSNVYLEMYRTSFQEFVAESIPANADKLFFSNTDFERIEWMEEGREFEWNTRLYDVSKIEKTKDGYEVYAVNDTVEENFLAMIDFWKKSHSPGNKTKSIFQPQFCNPLYPELIAHQASQKLYFFYNSGFYNPPVRGAFSPPPES